MKLDGSWSRLVCLALLGFSGCSTIMGYDDGTLLGDSDTQHLGGTHSGGAHGDFNALGNLAGAIAGGQTGATSNQSAGTEVNPSACSTAAAAFAPLSVAFTVGTDLAATGFVPRDPTNTGLAQIVSTPANLCSAGCLQMSQTYFVSDGAYTRSISLVMPLGGTSYSNMTGAKIVVGLAVDNPQSTPLVLSIFASNANGSIGQVSMSTAELAGFALTSGVRDYAYSVTDIKDDSNRQFCASSVTELGIMLQNSATITAASAGTVNVYVQSVSVSPSEGTPNTGVGGATNPPATNQAGAAGAVGGTASTSKTVTGSTTSMDGEGGVSTTATSTTPLSAGGTGSVAAASTMPSGGVAAAITLPSGGGTGGVAATSTPSTSHCGNGIVETDLGEECDDRGVSSKCDGDCSKATCGDGYVNTEAGEECDDGAGADTPTCNGVRAAALACRRPRCGDGYVNNRAEGCDTLGGEDSPVCNGSSAPTGIACKARICGDRYMNHAAEECDDGAEADTPTCNGLNAPADLACLAPQCGDGYVNRAAGEECDAGPVSVAGCKSCQVDAGYSCAPSSLTGASVCSPICGDGLVVAEEACDDGNTDVCGTCNATCTAVSAGHDCITGIGCMSSADCASNVCIANRCEPAAM